jgi:hypothetical protein
VILEPTNYERWLDRADIERPPVDLLTPYQADEMSVHPVDPRVGSVRNNEPSPLRLSPNSQLRHFSRCHLQFVRDLAGVIASQDSSEALLHFLISFYKCRVHRSASMVVSSTSVIGSFSLTVRVVLLF